MSRMAIVEFRHARHCTTGQPYGNCDRECGWKVEQFVDEIKAPRDSRVSQKITEDWETEIRKLPDGWDSYGGNKISEDAIVSTILFIHNLSTANVIPTSRGGLAISWVISGIHDNIGPDAEIVVEFDEKGHYVIPD